MNQPAGATPRARPRRFPIRFTGANRTMGLIGITRPRCYVEVDADRLRVHMGWAFAAAIPRSSVRSVTFDHDRVLGWGVHGWRGKWLVNGSSSGIVRIEIDPAVRARVLVFPIRLGVLRVSVDQPDELIVQLTRGRSYIDAMEPHLTQLRVSSDRLRALIAPLDDATLERPAYPSEWSIADVLSHIGSDAEKDGLEFALGPLTLSPTEFVAMRLNEHALHTWDIEVGLDPGAVVPIEAAALVVDNLGLIARFTGKPTGAERTITVATADPSRTFRISLTSDAVDFAPADTTGAPDLALPAEAFVRLIYGRLDPDHTPPFTGSEELLDVLRQTYPGP